MRGLFGRTVVRAAAGVMVLTALLWAVAVTGLGMSLVVPAALERAAPEGWTVRVGSADGAWHSRVRLRDLELEGPDASASVAELVVDYRLLPFLSRTIALEQVRILRPAVRASLTSPRPDTIVKQQQSDGGRGLDALVSGSPLGSWAMHVSELEVRHAEATLLRENGAYAVSNGRLAASAALTRSGTHVLVDTLTADVVPPAPSATDSLAKQSVGPGRLVLSADLQDGLLRVRTLSFESSRSHVVGSGELLLAAVPGLVDSVDFQLSADPLDLRDLPIALPGPWADEPRVTTRVTARGAVDSMVMQASLEGPGETSGTARAILRVPDDSTLDDEPRRPTLEMTANISGDLSPWSLGPLSGHVTAELDLLLDSLSASAPATVEATLVHRPVTDTLGGLVGRDLRVDLELTRGPARGPPHEGAHPRGAVGADADDTTQPGRLERDAPLEVAATIHARTAGPEAGSEGWSRVGVLRAAGTERRADWSLELALDSGSVAGQGSAEWTGERAEWVVERLEVQDFDASALASGFPETDVTALLEAGFAGAAIDELSGTVALQVSPSSFAASPLTGATLRARVDSGSVQGAFMADAAGREVSSDFDLTLGDSVVSASLSRLRVFTPADSAAAEGAASPLEIWGRGSGTWSLGEVRRGTFVLRLDSAVVAGFTMRGGAVEGGVIGDSLSAVASLQVEDVLAAPASVDASLDARGLSLAEMVGRIELSAERSGSGDSTTGARAVGTDSLLMTLTANEPGQLVLDGRLLPAGGGRIDVDGSGTMAGERIAFDLVAAGGFGTPTDLLRQATIETLLLEASGARDRGSWEALRGRFVVRSAEWRGVTADTVRLEMSLDSSDLRLDTLDVVSEVLVLAGGGSLPRSEGTGQLDFRASFQLEPLHDVVSAELPLIAQNAVAATVTGATDSLDVAVLLELEALSYGNMEIAGVSAEARSLLEPPFSEDFGVTAARADIELDAIALPDADVQNLTASLGGSPDSLGLEVSARVDGERTGELAATIDPRPDGRTAQLERFELQLDEDQWELAQPASVAYADGYSLRSFHLAAGEQAILIDGGVTGAGALDLSIDMDSTDVGTVSDLLGLPRLDGWLGGRVRLDGTVEEPRGTADLSAGFHVEGRPPTTVEVRLESEGSRLVADVDLLDATGGTITVDGSMPLPGAAAPAGPASRTGLALQVEADGFDVSSAVAFVDSDLLTTLDGRVDASLSVDGSLDAPRFDGPVELSNGSARLPELGLTWEDMRLHAHGEGARLVVDSAWISAGPGYLTLAGTATAGATTDLDIGVNLEDFQAIRNDEYQAVVSGQLHVGGTVTRPVVEGDVQVESLDVYIGESSTTAGLEDVELTEEDLEMLRQRFGYIAASGEDDPTTGELLTADFSVALSRNSWLRKRGSPELAVPFTGEVEVQLRPQAEPRLQGEVTTIAERGYIQQFGKRFEPREGTVTFDGPADSARVDLSATYTIPSHTNPDNAEATIVLSVEGTQNSLSLTLSSEPPMENADIVSYIATGRPAASNLALGGDGADEAGAGPEGGLTEAGAGVALGQIVGAVERAAQDGVGLDVVEIRRDGIRGATLVAGKYLSPRLYVGFAQPVTRQEADGPSLGNESESEVEIEYQALRGLLLNIEGSDSALRIFLRGRLAY
jgi:autotransporter translocation and assembly factor TamB